MVSFTEIADAIKANPNKTANLKTITSHWKSFPIERFPITLRSQSAFVEDAPAPAHQRVEKAQTLVQAPKLLILPEEEEEEVAPVPTAQPIKVVAAPVPSAVAAAPAPVTKKLNHKPHDPVAIGIEHNEPLYTSAGAASKQQMEREEALRIEGMVGELYKSQGGRNRGWTKTMLEDMLRPRCASGGDIYELDRAKKGFVWQLVITDKAMSGFLDFICVAKRIRVCVWFEEEKMVVLYPAADFAGPESSNTLPLYHVTSQGQFRGGIRSCKDLLNFCKKMGHTLIPPHSVFHSLSHLTLAELESVGKKLGMAEVTGSKTQRVAAVAAYKLEQRLAAE